MSQRLISLDFFRGFTIAAMIVVNDPGSWTHVFGPLRHASWHGATPTDLVFPFFLFIVGVSIVLSLSKIKNGNKSVYLKIIKRTFILFGIGIFSNIFHFHYHLFYTDYSLIFFFSNGVVYHSFYMSVYTYLFDCD